MPQTLDDAIYVLMVALILIGLTIIGWFINQGFRSVVSQIKSLGEHIGNLSMEIRKEREARIRSGARLWGKFETIQEICNFRHGVMSQNQKIRFEDLEEDEDA